MSCRRAILMNYPVRDFGQVRVWEKQPFMRMPIPNQMATGRQRVCQEVLGMRKIWGNTYCHTRRLCKLPTAMKPCYNFSGALTRLQLSGADGIGKPWNVKS